MSGEQREYVEQVAESLVARDVEVFYDHYETADMWGRDLFEHLDDVYRRQARLCVLFVSHDYRDKVWPTHERRSAQARGLREDAYVLPVRFDDTEIPGIRETVAYIDARSIDPQDLADAVLEKLRVTPDPLAVPPNPDRLWAALAAERLRKGLGSGRVSATSSVTRRCSKLLSVRQYLPCCRRLARCISQTTST